MEHAARHIIKRGLEAHATYRASKVDDNHDITIPAWGIASLAITTLSFMIGLSSIHYTYDNVIPALAMIESPTGVLLEPRSSHGSDAPLDEKDIGKTHEVEYPSVLVQQPHITSTLRGTLKHLHARAGFLSRFRGLSIYIIYSILLSQLTALFTLVPFIPRGLDFVLASVVMARFDTTWTHIVFTEASPKPWYRRILNRKIFKQVAIPSAVAAAAFQLALALPFTMFRFMGLNRAMSAQELSGMSPSELQSTFLKFIFVAVSGLVGGFVLVFPTTVALTRVQASLLSQEENTIVPFDQTFEGRVAEGQVIGMLEAWKSFDYNARVRVMRIYLKSFALKVAMMVIFLVSVSAQLSIILGTSMDDVVRIARAQHSTAAEVPHVSIALD